MTTKTIFANIVIIIWLLVGVFLRGFCGGILIGACSMLLLFSTIGRWQLKKAAKIIDNNINKRL